MGENIMENGKMELCMGRGQWFMILRVSIKEILRMEKEKEKECITLEMEGIGMVNGMIT